MYRSKTKAHLRIAVLCALWWGVFTDSASIAAGGAVYKSCRFYETGSSRIVASDNVNVIISTKDNEIISLNTKELTKNWSFELPGAISSKSSIKDGIFYVRTKNQNNVAGESTLTSINLETGIPIKNELIEDSFQTEKITAESKATSNSGMNFEDLSAQTTEKNATAIGRRNGEVILTDSLSGAAVWKAKTGGQISGLIITEKGVLVASFDNFLYYLKLQTADRIWKKRFSGRLSGIFKFDEKHAAVQVLENDFVSLINLDKGQEAGKIEIKSYEKVKQIVFFSEKSLIILTERGLYRFSSNGCGE